jgi:glycosyltransferase involved in cell wall biosynthesis
VADSAPAIACLSLEGWDDVWRRNQHFAARLVRSGAARSVRFIGPPKGGFVLRAKRSAPVPGIEAVTPPLVVPRRAGGHRVLAAWLRRNIADADLLWINDPVAGAGVLAAGLAAIYDVTDDWRSMPQPRIDRNRTVAAEDVLARSVPTVVCSEVLAQRWRERYGVEASVVRNGVDTAALRDAQPMDLPGAGPHAVYVGTVHANRIDVSLVETLAASWPGTVHLVGPQGLDAVATRQLADRGVRMSGPVLSDAVARWLVSADVLICPHLVDEFTLSLDAIKSHEYLATDRPVVATPSSGFQTLRAPGLTVADSASFAAAVLAAAGTGPFRRAVAVDWDERAAQFAAALGQAVGP